MTSSFRAQLIFQISILLSTVPFGDPPFVIINLLPIGFKYLILLTVSIGGPYGTKYGREFEFLGVLFKFDVESEDK